MRPMKKDSADVHDHDGQVMTRAATRRRDPANSDGRRSAARYADFATMTEALDYVAAERSAEFPRRAGQPRSRRSYFRASAGSAPPRTLVARGLVPGDRSLDRETAAEFVALFFGALYAGVWPVPLPLPTSFGGRDAYIDQLAVPAEERRSRASRLSARSHHAGTPPSFGIAPPTGRASSPRRPRRRRSARRGPDDIAYLHIRADRRASRHGVVITTVP